MMKCELRDRLLNLQNNDGGWGYESGKQSNTEATSFALLALLEMGQDARVSIPRQQGLTWLRSLQAKAGYWPLTHHLSSPSWATAIAVLALSQMPEYRRAAQQGGDWLAQQKGRKGTFLQTVLYRFARRQRPHRLNPNIQGWSWVEHTASWVEPTAQALIALKSQRAITGNRKWDERIREGEALLYDRMCLGGGWNYGNAVVLNRRLTPYPDSTALALLALQDQAHRNENRASIDVLQEMIQDGHSGLTLSLSIVCLSLYGHDTTRLHTQLLERYTKTGFLGRVKPLALTLLALDGQVQPFRV